MYSHLIIVPKPEPLSNHDLKMCGCAVRRRQTVHRSRLVAGGNAHHQADSSVWLLFGRERGVRSAFRYYRAVGDGLRVAFAFADGFQPFDFAGDWRAAAAEDDLSDSVHRSVADDRRLWGE